MGLAARIFIDTEFTDINHPALQVVKDMMRAQMLRPEYVKLAMVWDDKILQITGGAIMNEKIKAVVDLVYEENLTAAQLVEVVRVVGAFREKGIGSGIFEDFDIEYLVRDAGLPSNDIIPLLQELQQDETRRCKIRI